MLRIRCVLFVQEEVVNGIDSVTHSIEPSFIDHILYARHCGSCWGLKKKKDIVLVVKELLEEKDTQR